MPRIVRRERSGLDHGIEIRQLHRLLAAARRVPQVGIADANQQEEAEEDQEDDLLGQQQAPPGSHEGPQRVPAPPDHETRHHNHEQQAGDNPPALIRHYFQARADPGQPRQDENTCGLADTIPAVGEAPEKQERDGESHDTQQLDDQQPDQQRHHGRLVDQAIRVEDIGPRAASPLARGFLVGQHQRRGGGTHLLGPHLDRVFS